MQNLREEHGYTYGVVAAMVNFEREGYFAVAAQVGTEVTQDALREIYTEIERLRAEPMPEGELSLVKNIMVGEMMRILDGPFGIADVTIENILCGRDHTVINENIRRIQAMTPADVQQLARKYLSREELVTVIAGDLRKETPAHCGCGAIPRPQNGTKKAPGIGAFPFPPPVTLSALPGPASDGSNPPKLRYPTSTTRRDYFRLAATQLVSCTKSATESCSARCVKGCSAPPKSPNTVRSELRIILRRWPNDAFTTFTNSASSSRAVRRCCGAGG